MNGVFAWQKFSYRLCHGGCGMLAANVHNERDQRLCGAMPVPAGNALGPNQATNDLPEPCQDILVSSPLSYLVLNSLHGFHHKYADRSGINN
eukprot:scaffold215161_cov38-Prasinocladus_malaysianus.AAC.1